MTEEEFKKIKWRMIMHMSTDTAHYATYKNDEYNIKKYTEIKVNRNGDYGREKKVYELEGIIYNTKKDLINEINTRRTNLK